MTGIPKLKIEELMKALDERMGKTRARLRMLQTRRNSHYFRIVYVHEELSRNPDREKRLNLMEELKEEKRKFERTCEELRNLQAGPSHRDIAEVMGIPKGSVDSGIYYIRHAYLRFSEREFRESEERKIA